VPGPSDVQDEPPVLATRLPTTRRWADLRLRVVSALVLGPLGLLVLWTGGIAWRALICAACLGVLSEWAGLCRKFAAARGAAVVAVGGGAAICLASATLIWLRDDPLAGRDDVLFLVLVVWASDIGAYTAGRLFGGPALSPSISPAKTWAGAAGGLLAALGGGALVAAVVTGGVMPGWGALRAALLLGLAAQLGDLAESAAKRAAGVKDSGWLIPGHGGLLDRLDGTIAGALAAGLLAMLAGRGVVFWR
jgi:phosphatidate cytidylyltransferase